MSTTVPNNVKYAIEDGHDEALIVAAGERYHAHAAPVEAPWSDEVRLTALSAAFDAGHARWESGAPETNPLGFADGVQSASCDAALAVYRAHLRGLARAR